MLTLSGRGDRLCRNSKLVKLIRLRSGLRQDRLSSGVAVVNCVM